MSKPQHICTEFSGQMGIGPWGNGLDCGSALGVGLPVPNLSYVSCKTNSHLMSNLKGFVYSVVI